MIDLKARFGAEYRIALDESASIPGQAREDRLWCYRVVCRYEHIFLQGADTLGAYTDRRVMRGRLEAIPGVRVLQRGDSELSDAFPPSLFPEVAKVLQPRKRRRLSEEQKARLHAASAGHRFLPGTQGHARGPGAIPGPGVAQEGL